MGDSILTVDGLVNWIIAGMGLVIAWLVKEHYAIKKESRTAKAESRADKAEDRRERLLIVGALHAITGAVQDMEKALIVVSERVKL